MNGETTYNLTPPFALEQLPELLTIREASKLLHVHANTLRNWEKTGLISAIRIGRRGDRRYKKATIEQIMHTEIL